MWGSPWSPTGDELGAEDGHGEPTNGDQDVFVAANAEWLDHAGPLAIAYLLQSDKSVDKNMSCGMHARMHQAAHRCADHIQYRAAAQDAQWCYIAKVQQTGAQVGTAGSSRGVRDKPRTCRFFTLEVSQF